MQNEVHNFLKENEDIELSEDQKNPQVLEQWKAARLGKFTASQIAKLLVKSKDGGLGAGAMTYVYKKAGEVLTLEANEVSSAAIKWGEEHEQDAVLMFEKIAGKKVTYYGKNNPVFFEHGLHAGGSPDGFVEEEKAVVETKCPFESGYHAEVFHLIAINKFDLKEFDKDYYSQIQFNMKVTNATHAYFVSYDPRVVDYKFSIAYARIERDEAHIKLLCERIELGITTKVQYLTEMGYYNEEEKAAA